MHGYTLAAIAAWLALMTVWLVSSLSAKRTVGGRRQVWVRAALGLLLAFLVTRFHPLYEAAGYRGFGPAWGWLGALLCVAGASLGIWARFTLGRNWGMPMSVKESPELVTSGPYASIRHPIYTAVILAMLGSGLAIMAWWLLLFAVFGGYFIYSARVEERNMQKLFPTEYPAYKKGTKMFVPFVF